MDDRELDVVLRAIAGERYMPPAGLVRRTKARIRGRRMLQVMLTLSIAMQLGIFVAVTWVLASSQVPLPAKVFGLAVVLAWTGASAVAVLSARGHVAWFFRRVEHILT